MQFSRYPSDNAVTFERWFLNDWSGKDAQDRIYLPIQWTALYCNNGYGNSLIVNTIQKFLNDLDTTKKYYTIVQYDDGIINAIDHLDIKVFAMAGPRIDYPLPLLCTPHKFNFAPDLKRDIFASFVGNYTHAMRAQMVDQLKGKEGYYISTKPHELRDYCQILARSKYALCPRGYGQSSFRIQEAIDFGAIPVYISDEHIVPYNFPFGYGLMLGHDDIVNIEEILQEDAEMIRPIFRKEKELFTYAGCKHEILNHLSNEQEKYNKGGNTEL